MYEKESNKKSEAIKQVVEDETISMEEVMRKVENINDKIKFKAFGKVTITGRKTIRDEHDDKSEEEKAESLAEEQERKAEEEIERIRKDGGN